MNPNTAAVPPTLPPRSPAGAPPRLLALLALAPMIGDTHEVRLVADRDNTLYETSDGSKSNGAGEHVFAGTTGTGAHRRALLHFRKRPLEFLSAAWHRDQGNKVMEPLVISLVIECAIRQG